MENHFPNSHNQNSKLHPYQKNTLLFYASSLLNEVFCMAFLSVQGFFTSILLSVNGSKLLLLIFALKQMSLSRNCFDSYLEVTSTTKNYRFIRRAFYLPCVGQISLHMIFREILYLWYPFLIELGNILS